MRKIILLLLLSITFTFNSCEKDDKIPETIQFEIYNQLPTIDVEINGKKARLLLDTGASLSLIDGTLHEFLEFDLITNPDMVEDVIGIGGKNIILPVRNLRVYHNGVPIYANFKASDLSNLRKRVNIDGIIGTDYFRQNDMIIDYKNRLIRPANMLD